MLVHGSCWSQRESLPVAEVPSERHWSPICSDSFAGAVDLRIHHVHRQEPPPAATAAGGGGRGGGGGARAGAGAGGRGQEQEQGVEGRGQEQEQEQELEEVECITLAAPLTEQLGI
jgi:hypothetical protein